jgi:hypothetical protein
MSLRSEMVLCYPLPQLSPVDAHKDKEAGWGATLKCASCPDCCGKRQEAPVQLSCDRKTELACLQELEKRLQDRHVECVQAVAKKAVADAQAYATVNPDTPNVLKAMMKLDQAKDHSKTANKVVHKYSGDNFRQLERAAHVENDNDFRSRCA